jgi:hypothetical protein
MKVLIQNRFTLEYLTPEETWAGKSENARVFATTADALQHCLHRGYRYAQLVIKRTGLPDLRLPLPDDFKS